MPVNAPVSFKVGFYTMAEELVAGALAAKEAVYCSNMMMELGFGVDFFNVPV